ncbi:MAG: MFS transporter [Acidimicrobiales bacterium]
MALSAGRRRGVLFAMCLSLVLVVASVSALNLALGEISVDLGTSSSALTWIADGYTVALAALVLPLGAVGDRRGRRNVLLAGTVVFGLSALFAVFAGSAGLLIAARVGMGIGAAMIMPGTLSTITAVFPADKRPTAVALWTAFGGAGAIIGMLVAGGLLEAFSWRSTFVVTAVLAAVSFVAALVLAPNTADKSHGRLDLPGSALSGIGIGGLVFAIIEGSEKGWTHGLALGGFALAAVGLIGYVVWDLRTETPLLDPRLFRLRGFSAGSIAVTMQFLAAFGFFFVGLQFLQVVLDYSPLLSALALVPLVATIMPVSQLTPRIVDRLGSRTVMATGLGAMAVGFLVLAQLTAASSYWEFLGGLVAFGVGMALAATPATTSIVNSLPLAKQGVASGMNDATREIGSALGIALLGSMFSSGYSDAVAGSTGGLPADAAHAVSESPAAGLQVAGQLGQAGDGLTAAVRTALIDGMSGALTIGAVVLAAAAAVILWRAPRRADEAVTVDDPDPLIAELERSLLMDPELTV